MGDIFFRDCLQSHCIVASFTDTRSENQNSFKPFIHIFLRYYYFTKTRQVIDRDKETKTIGATYAVQFCKVVKKSFQTKLLLNDFLGCKHIKITCVISLPTFKRENRDFGKE